MYGKEKATIGLLWTEIGKKWLSGKVVESVHMSHGTATFTETCVPKRRVHTTRSIAQEKTKKE